MPHTAGITELPYNAHLDYARRVDKAKQPLAEGAAPAQKEVVTQNPIEPLMVDARLAHFMDAGRPKTRAMYPGPPPMFQSSEVWGMGASLFHVRPVKLWNGLKKRHPSILACLKALRDVITWSSSVWKGRHELVGE